MMILQNVLLMAAPDSEALLDALRRGEVCYDPKGPARLAMINPTEDRRQRAIKLVTKGKASHGIQDMWFSPGGLLLNGGKLAFMYPGIDSSATVETHEVADSFQLPRVRSHQDASLENRGNEVFFTSDLYSKILERLEIRPDYVLGHSIGEWSAMLACGYTADQTVEEIAAAFRPGMLPVPGLVFVALGCGVEQARAAIAGLPEIEVSHDNCPHQSILCGIEASADLAIARLSGLRIMCQKLDFQSGFHTALFKNFTGPIAKSFGSLNFSKPRYPLWSATTCQPYPEPEDQVKGLLLQHLVEPVRFRELTEALYQKGARVFLQVGSGSLPGFVDDTLRGRPHLCLSTLHPQRAALAQLQRFYLGLFVEGAVMSLKGAQPQAMKGQSPRPAVQSQVEPTVSVPSVSQAELLREMEACFQDMREAMQEVTFALQSTAPFRKIITMTLSLPERPELMDHCIYRQKRGWKNASDLFPVMPMTATIDWIREIAEQHVSDRLVIAVEQIRASKWLAVESRKDLEIELTYDGRSRLKVDILGHFVATAVLATAYPEAPACSLLPLINPKPSEIPMQGVYRDGWLFHGPLYQCLETMDAVGDDGIDGSIRATPTRGALLDNAGQLAGLWVMQRMAVDRYAMPIRIARVSFFGPQPTSGILDTKVRNTRVRSRDLSFEIEVSTKGQVWAKLEGWEKWRFECDDVLWQFLLKPGRRLMADQRRGFSWFEPSQISDAIAHEMARRYLREAEFKIYQSLGRKQKSWICGRIAAKDAIRHYLWAQGYPHDIFPAEIWIENDIHGKPCITELPGATPLFISISHKEGLGVALVRQKSTLGIDIEKIDPRESSFEAIAFTAVEQDMIPKQDRYEWITRFWGAKEAFAKSSGLGLQGDPKNIVVEEFKQDRIRIQSSWVQSTKVGSFIVSQFEG